MWLYRTSHSVSEDVLERIVEQFAKNLHQPITFCLEGELGAGKTHFVRSWLKKITNDSEFPSPTFSVMQEYQDIKKLFTIYHADLYRLHSLAEAEEIGLPEMLNDGLSFVEWPSKIPELFSSSCWWLTLIIDENDDQKRYLKLRTPVKIEWLDSMLWEPV